MLSEVMLISLWEIMLKLLQTLKQLKDLDIHFTVRVTA